MKNLHFSKRLYAVLAVFALTLGLGASVVRAADNGLAGKWKMVSTTPDGSEFPWTLVISYQDGKYNGTIQSEQGDVAAKDFKVDGTTVTLTGVYQDNDYQVRLKLMDGKLKGSWSGGGDTGDIRGEKAGAS
ncbi:MAG: hypothetical protein JO033_15035 [Acidobacteriaceae bacterium]|nr:hypothetical protein [Acidobacteriaceae bacterium]MBV9500228.1 hypothetical protein [Acidobacteriaceae bacterium]